MTILVVDDNEQNLYQLQVLLGANGYQVASAANGAEALAQARQNPPDLIISDILMPVMDGFALCREWKKDERLKAIPFVFYTATYTDDRDRNFALSLGAERFIVKPEEPDNFLRAIREATEQVQHAPGEPVHLPIVGLETEETGQLRQYNEVLVRKLESKMQQLEHADHARERELVERKRAARELQESKQLIESVVENVPLMIFLKEAQDLRFVVFNQAGEELLGYDRKDLLGKNNLDLFPPEQAAFFMAKDREALAGGVLLDIPEESILTAKKGQRLLHTRKVCIKGADGVTKYLLGISEDITERKHAEEALRESEARFRLLFEQAADSILILDIVPDGVPVIRDANSATLRLLGYERHEFIGQPLSFIEPAPDFSKLVHERRESILSGTGTVFEASHRCKDGTIRQFECSAAETRIGSKTFAISVERDITERHRLEEQLREAQKMDAIGRLAGGVAHDFNNALAVIQGFSELALLQLNPLDPLRRHLDQIIRAVEKSADLTRQLLAFARRQVVTPRVLDLNVAIASLAKMLPRLIGEDIDLRIVPGEGLWNVRIDPTQVDQILVNLVTNARDAIANTGTITIETSDVVLGEEYCRRHPGLAPGEYLLLAVTDSGIGMDKATLERAFEPFFTTKAEGKGTGLGLATVYGIAKQNGGLVDVYSEPAHGTTFKVYLPRFVGEAEQPAQKKEPGSLRGTETVLIVEDEPLLLEIIGEGLQELGYDVVTAGSPGDAILLCEKHAGAIHLLLTDVIMPTMNGKELQQRLERIKPGLRTIFMSGYTANVVASRGIVDADMLFIQKPFTFEALASKVREALQD
jgi:PAS domain S-box-containing protein